MNYKITTDLTKLKKEKCDDCEGKILVVELPIHGDTSIHDCKTCSGTGIEPIKITYKAGECETCMGTGRIKVPYPYGFKGSVIRKCLDCNGTGKLHPKVGDFIYWFTSPVENGWLNQQEYDILLSSIGKKEAEESCIKHKFLSIDKAKEEAMVVQVE